jgi:hypothetical protein
MRREHIKIQSFFSALRGRQGRNGQKLSLTNQPQNPSHAFANHAKQEITKNEPHQARNKTKGETRISGWWVGFGRGGEERELTNTQHFLSGMCAMADRQ